MQNVIQRWGIILLGAIACWSVTPIEARLRPSQTCVPKHSTDSHANMYCYPKGSIALSGEVLFWHPCGDCFTLASVVTSSFVPHPLFTFRPKWDEGFRVGVGYVSCDRQNSIEVRYTYFEESNGINVVRPTADLQVISLPLKVERVNGQRRYRYQTVDVRFAHLVFDECARSFHVIGSIGYFDLRDRIRYSVPITPAIIETSVGQTAIDETTIKDQARIQGASLQTSIKARWELCGCLGLSTEAGGLIVVGQNRNKWLRESSDPLTGLVAGGHIPNSFDCAPGFDFRIGLDGRFACGCFQLQGEIGYEIRYYYSIVRHPRGLPLASAGDINATEIESFSIGFQGPYAGLRLQF